MTEAELETKKLQLEKIELNAKLMSLELELSKYKHDCNVYRKEREKIYSDNIDNILQHQEQNEQVGKAWLFTVFALLLVSGFGLVFSESYYYWYAFLGIKIAALAFLSGFILLNDIANGCFVFGKKGSYRRQFVHNAIVHPLMMFMSPAKATAMHDKSAIWTYANGDEIGNAVKAAADMGQKSGDVECAGLFKCTTDEQGGIVSIRRIYPSKDWKIEDKENTFTV